MDRQFRNHKVEAELVKLEGEVVYLKKADGSIAKVPLSKLCPADRDFVRQQTAAGAATAGPKADSEVKPGASQPALSHDTPPKAAGNDPKPRVARRKTFRRNSSWNLATRKSWRWS